MGAEPDVSVIFPSIKSVARRPLPSTGSRWDGSPASAVLSGAPTSARPSRLARFPSLSGTSWRRRADLPGSWGVLASMPRSPTPVERRCPGRTSSAVVPSVFPSTSASTREVISGLHHAAYGLAVYASQLRSPASTQDSLPAGDLALAGRDFHPLDSVGGFSSVQVVDPPPPGFAWRTGKGTLFTRWHSSEREVIRVVLLHHDQA